MSAEWVAAIGQVAGAAATVGAVGAALWIAIRDGRRRDKDQARPLILPAGDPALIDPTGEPTLMAPGNPHTVRLPIRNAGSGPALYVRTHLEPGGHSPDLWSLGALAQGDIQPLTFSGYMFDQQQPRAQLLLDYRDMAGRAYSTAITIEVVSGVPRFYDVRVFENHSVTHLGDAVYPQPGLRDVRPRRAPKFRPRIKAAIRALRGQA